MRELAGDTVRRYFVTAISTTNNESDPLLMFPLTTTESVP